MKFVIKKNIMSHKKNKNWKFPDISSDNTSSLQKDNKENIQDNIKTKNNNHTQINIAEFSETGYMPKPKDKIDTHSALEEEKEEVTCHHCKEKLGKDWKEPHWKWNLEKNIRFCMNCYIIKESEYEKMMNYCTVCNSKLKFIRYNPKSEWKIRGQLCRKCWDSQNSKYKSGNN